MPFGSGNSLRVRRPNFRSNLIEDMQNVSEGRRGIGNNSRLIQDFSKTFTGVKSLTKEGSFVAIVGATVVGSDDKIGTPDKFELEGV